MSSHAAVSRWLRFNHPQLMHAPAFCLRRLGQRVLSRACARLTVSLLAALAVPVRSFAQAPTFNALVTTATNSSFNFPGSQAVGDYNGDGKLDTLVTDGSTDLRLLLGDGTGSFSASNVGTSGTNPGAIRAADLNGDGRLDAVTVSNGGNFAVTVLLNTGNDGAGKPQFAIANYFTGFNQIRSVAIGDLNGDGKPDLVVGNALSLIVVFLNNGDGTFTKGQVTSLVPGASSPSVGPGAIADLNGDGKADYVAVSVQNGASNIFYGNGDGTLQAPVALAPTGQGLAVADVNHDGRPDLLAVNDSSLIVFLNNGGGSFGAATTYPTGGLSAFSISTADFNGDGQLDAVVGNFDSNSVSVLLGDGSGAFGAANVYAVNQKPLEVAVGQVNTDGKLDIVTVGRNDKTVGVLLNTTVAPLPTQTLTILGGFGNVGDVAANVEYFNPATGHWQPAYLADFAPYGHPVTHPWGNISGTNHWINYRTDGGSEPGAGPTIANTLWYLYRVRFTVPADAQSAQMTFSVKADNLAQVAINGASTGPTIVGEANQLSADAVFSQNVHPGENTITLNIGDYGGLNGFNFRIDLSVRSSQPLEIVPATPPDTTPPVIAAIADITREATSAAGAAVTFNATASDNVDGAVPVIASPASGSTFPITTTIVGLAASDAAHNTATASFKVTVQDTKPPVIGAPASMVPVEATGPNGAAVTFSVPAATDLVDGNVAVLAAPASGSTFAIGNTTVNLTATDTRGNSASSSLTVTVQDTKGPAIAAPGNQVAEATSAAGAVVTFNATASDLVDGAVGVTATPGSGTTFPLGTTTVNLGAIDTRNNASSASFTVLVRDTTPPALTVSGNVTAEATGASGAAVSYAAATATDAVTASPAIAYSAASGSTFPLGNTTVSVTATDAANNATTKAFTVAVKDTVAPALTLPANQTLEATSAAGAAATFAASATDVVTASPALTYSAASGTTFPLGTTTVTVTAKDGANNAASGSFTIKVQDTTKPVIAALANLTLEATGPSGAVATFAPTASDAVGATVTAAPVSGSTFALGTTTVTVNAADAAGNVATPKAFTVTVRDTTGPVITAANVVAEATSDDGARVTFSATALDAVSGTRAVSFSRASGSQFPLGVTTVTATAKDALGNPSTKTFTVTVRDTTAPKLDLPRNITACAESAAGAKVSYEVDADDLVTSDRRIVLTYSKASGSVFPLGTTTVTVTATDEAGNRATGSFTVTVKDTTKPLFTKLSITPTLLTANDHSMVTATVTAIATDKVDPTLNVRIVSVTSDEAITGTGAGDVGPDWEITGPLTVKLRAERDPRGNGRIYTVFVAATDDAGNTITRSLHVLVAKSGSKFEDCDSRHRSEKDRFRDEDRDCDGRDQGDRDQDDDDDDDKQGRCGWR